MDQITTAEIVPSVASAQEVFRLFVEWNNAHHPASGPGSRGHLSAHTAYLYGLFWASYTQYLCDKRDGLPWHQATKEDVQAFLHSVQPRSRREVRAGGVSRRTSHVTVQRYETVLHRVYAYAVTEHQCEMKVSPVHRTRLPEKQKREHADSFLLHAGYRAKLLQGIPRNAVDWGARDAALLALMAMQGITPAEIACLQCAFVEWGPEFAPPINWIWQEAQWPEVPRPLALHIPCVGRDAQARRLMLDELSAVTLQNWLRWRGPKLPAVDQDMVFFGQRGAMSTNRTYEVVSEYILSILVGPQEDGAPERTLYHAGPMALRTSAIMAWLESIDDVQEVLRRAGLAEVKSLDRIARHASESASKRYRKALALTSADDMAVPAEQADLSVADNSVGETFFV